MADVYGYEPTPEEKAETEARRLLDAQPCACKTVLEKPGRGAAPRPVWKLCDQHAREYAERRARWLADYRARTAAHHAAGEGAIL